MGYVTFVCPLCRASVSYPPSLAGVRANCPKCGRSVDWKRAGPSSPAPAKPAPPAPGPAEADREADRPRARRTAEPPHGLALACYMVAGAAAVTLFMPLIWFTAVPLAAASGMAAVYLLANFRAPAGVGWALVVSLGVLLFGLTRGHEINRMLRDIAEPEPEPRRIRR